MSDVLGRLTTALEERYRVIREIGVGGMATVYLAHDLRHERDVAIKVLHPDLAAALGAERFLAEIKTTAKLQHPHILPLLDSGEASGLLYYVMPYVAGESLRTRLDRETQLAVDDAVRIAREVASALDYAHRHGVVHRDIKPENILIHEEQALVADFGIALAVSAAGGARMTQTGLSLGTPAYMAPEQAMGERAIDGRADIYALGAVLYEMLVGEAPFTGPTVQAIVARVMTESPRPVTGQRKSVPPNVNAAVLRALEKLPADRFHSAAEFSTALASPTFDSRSAPLPRADKSSLVASLRHPAVPWVIAAVAVATSLYFATRRNVSRVESRPIHLAIDFPSNLEMPPGVGDAMGISNDGRTVAFTAAPPGGRGQLFLRDLDNSEIRPVEGSSGVSGSAAFSPDGQWVAFSTQGKVFKASVKGGPPTPIATAQWAQMVWTGDDVIIYTRNYNTGLYRISAEGQDSATLTTPDRSKGELGHWWPQLLPDGEHILFTNYVTPANRSKLEVMSLRSGERRVVLEGGYYGHYVNNHLVFARDAGLMVVPFDLRALKAKGSAVPLQLDVEISPPNGWAAFATSPNGTLMYRTDAGRNVVLSWVDEGGNEEPAVDSSARFTHFAPAPDGRRIAVVRDGDVWIYDRQRKLFSRLTQTDQSETELIWSPDSREVFYSRDVPQYDIFKRVADGSRPEELVVTSAADKEATSISPDGKVLLYDDDSAGTDEIYATSPNPADKAPKRKMISGPGSQNYARFSPDGQWIAYASSESGRQEIYLAPWPLDRGPARQQVSESGGAGPAWGPDGRTIYYGYAGRLFRTRVNPRTGEIGAGEMLSRIAPVLSGAIASDGRFLVSRSSKASERRSLKVVLNWASTLNERK